MISRRLALAVACAVLVPTTGARAAESVRAPGDYSSLRTERLSDERTVTRFAHAVTTARITSLPKPGAKIRGRLRYQTEDKFPEPYLVLRSVVDDAGRVWMQVRIPGRPNGRKGWVPQAALSELYVVETFLRIDRRRARATLFKRGRKVWSSRIGYGKPGTPTPAGRFIIREKLRAAGGAYGPWAFGTSAYSRLSDWPGGGVIGMHGTDQPELIPGRPSHGCVRVPNAKIRRLARLMPVGTPVRIL